MAAKYILAAISAIFFFFALLRMARGSAVHPQARIWLLVAVIFGAVSAWLFYQG